MIWMATEKAGTGEISRFEQVPEREVLYLLDGFKANMSNPTKFRLQDTEDGVNVIYEGVTYKGKFGYNVRVANKYMEL